MADKIVVSSTTAKLPGGDTILLKTQTYYNINSDGSVTPGKIEVYKGTRTQTSVRSGESITYTLAATSDKASDGLYKGAFKKVKDSPLTDAEFKSLNTTNGVINTSVKNGVTNAAVKKGNNEPGLSQGQAQALTGAPQTAPNTSANVGAATTAQFTQPEAIAAIKYRDVRTKYANLSYPKRRSNKQDYIEFKMLEYSPRAFYGANLRAFEGGIDEGLGQPVFGDERLGPRNTIGRVWLPISSPISDTNTVNWGEDTAGALSTLGSSVYMNLVGGPTTQNTDNTKPSSGESGGSSNATKTMITSELAKAAVGGGNGGNLLTRTTGAISNPNTELLFTGPYLRTFSFTFPLLARSKEESKEILQIIRFFKQGMSVKRSTSALFLKSPHTFKIKYIYAGTGKNHPWINKIKECALTNCTVNYTPAGNFATYENGAMTMYEMTLNFSELEPIFDDDYNKLGNDDGNAPGKDTMIGY